MNEFRLDRLWATVNLFGQIIPKQKLNIKTLEVGSS